MSNDNENTPLEQSLSEMEGPAPGAWERMRRDLAGAAERSGLIDVAFERHDSPLGVIIVGATRDGLGRVGLAAGEGGGGCLPRKRRRSCSSSPSASRPACCTPRATR